MWVTFHYRETLATVETSERFDHTLLENLVVIGVQSNNIIIIIINKEKEKLKVQTFSRVVISHYGYECGSRCIQRQCKLLERRKRKIF